MVCIFNDHKSYIHFLDGVGFCLYRRVMSPFKVNDLSCLLSARSFGGAGVALKQEECGKDDGIAPSAGNRCRRKFERHQDGSKVDQGVQAHSERYPIKAFLPPL